MPARIRHADSSTQVWQRAADHWQRAVCTENAYESMRMVAIGRITRGDAESAPSDRAYIGGGASRVSQIRSYHVEYTASHQNCEVKRRWAYLVLRWGTTWERYGAVSFFFSSPFFFVWLDGVLALPPVVQIAVLRFILCRMHRDRRRRMHVVPRGVIFFGKYFFWCMHAQLVDRKGNLLDNDDEPSTRVRVAVASETRSTHNASE